MEKENATKFRRIHHLRNGTVQAAVKVMHSGVDKGWPFIGDEELIEGDAVRLLPGRDAVDTADDFINPGVGRVP